MEPLPDPGGGFEGAELDDLVEGGMLVDLDSVVEGTGEGGLVPAVVKMKLNTFLHGPNTGKLKAKLHEVVLDGNRLLGEGYAFANFHVSRLLEVGNNVPIIDRNFYYRCLLAVCVSNCRADTLGDAIAESARLFDGLRDPAQPKVDATIYNQLIADLSISMATMASNHLWMNLDSRIEGFLRWRHPDLKKFHKAVVRAVAVSPRESIDKIFEEASTYCKPRRSRARAPAVVEQPAEPKPEPKPKRVMKMTPAREAKLKKELEKAEKLAVKKAREDDQRVRAMAAAAEMRELLPLRGKRFASKGFLTLRLYHSLLRQTEAGKAAHQVRMEGLEAGERKPFKGRLFSLLPVKSSFTTSYVPISSMFLLALLRSIGLSKHEGDGRKLNHRDVWSPFFGISLVETHRSRTFKNRIMTDGYAISALVSCKVPLDTSKGKSDVDVESMNELVWSAAEGTTIQVVGVDPGFTDVVTASFDNGKSVSYSSSRYYEVSKVKYSQRRTRVMNDEKKAVTDSLLATGGGKTADNTKLAEYTRVYLSVLRPLLVHRMAKQYRKLRFLRHVYKQKAVKEIVDLIVSPDPNVLTLVGFGNWSGGSRSPISRKHAGPIQMIKEKIGRRPNAAIKPVDEYLTSQLDSNHQGRLVNMRATTTKKMRDGSKVVRLNNKVHKVLHCKPSANCKLQAYKETTWNRDVNASRNILNLFHHELNGLARPSAFCRPEKKARFVGRLATGDGVINPESVITAALTEVPGSSDPDTTRGTTQMQMNDGTL